ncbi:hypothetical protein [Paraferrimonas sp. SM1919]|uniref:hypothetical protein n=1 Tax=Paraferrimonas sp. SM1919 TaxID=2662263 RepID=UPI0013D17E2F|nr:hypothetical protein [Paraferrimonas sp. SM1919]
MYLKIIWIVAIFLFLLGCVNDETSNSTIWVYQYQQSQTCQLDSGLTQQQVRQSLDDAGIAVLCQGMGHTGLPQASVCGITTNEIYAFEIFKDKLLEAENLGYLILDDLEHAEIEVSCKE